MKSAILIFAVAILGFIGWVMNIVAVFKLAAISTWGGLEVARIVGIFIAPLGSLLGWFA